jgi:ABC-type Na+ efflux pump permease subunit
MINFIPLPYRIVIVVMVLLAVYTIGRVQGGASVQEDWDSQKLHQELANSFAAKEQAEQNVKVVTQYVDRIKVVHDKGETITKEVKVYVDNKADANCSVPNGFGVLWNAANRGELPTAARDSNEATSPIVLSDIATQHSNEAEICRETEQQLISLQAWVRDVLK